MTFKKYIQELAPTTGGLLAVGLCFIVIPLMADIVFWVSAPPRRGPVTMSTTLLNGYIYFFPWLLIYLIVNFFLLKKLFHHFKPKAD